jgi:ParB/RepB/Spo0J family partition protein
MAKRLTKRPLSKRGEKKSSVHKTVELKRSSLEIFDIPDDLLIDSPDNPQEMDDATFDELVEGIRNEGFDEPIHVIKIYGADGEWNGKYMITSGHHRRKAGRVTGMEEFPAIIKKDMDDAARKIALVRRNQLKGNMNKKKFSALFSEVAPVLGEATAKRLMGFTKENAFAKLYEDVAKTLPASARKQMDEAKETVRSVDDLSSILNNIFKQEGSKVQNGYMVFSYGGKKHHYFQIDNNVSKMLERITAKLAETGEAASDFFAKLLKDQGELSVQPKKVNRVKTGKK